MKVKFKDVGRTKKGYQLDLMIDKKSDLMNITNEINKDNRDKLYEFVTYQDITRYNKFGEELVGKKYPVKNRIYKKEYNYLEKNDLVFSISNYKNINMPILVDIDKDLLYTNSMLIYTAFDDRIGKYIYLLFKMGYFNNQLEMVTEKPHSKNPNLKVLTKEIIENLEFEFPEQNAASVENLISEYALYEDEIKSCQKSIDRMFKTFADEYLVDFKFE